LVFGFFRDRGRFVLLGALGALSACSSSGGNAVDDNSNVTAPVASPPTIVTPPPPALQTPASGYDTSVGNGVDSAGFADLPLHSGANRYFVSSATGSDANSCAAAKSPSTPRATITAAATCVTKGAGDQLLVAQGTSYADFPNLTDMDGFSPVYPTVIQSYDPAEPTNEAKYGRAAGNRPVITKAGQWYTMMGGGTSPQYTAVRGFDFDPGNLSKQEMMFLANTNGLPNYFLFENNILAHVSFVANLARNGSQAIGWVIRGNSFYGAWAGEAGYHTQGVYMSYVHYTLEDNVIWHAGWKVGANRDDSVTAGGLVGDDVFRHPIYAQFSSDGTARRNLIMDGAADGGMMRGDIIANENLGIDNPIGLALGGGTNYNTDRPGGVLIQADYNVHLGSVDIDAANPRGGGISTSNGKPGSYFRHGIIAHRATLAPGQTYAAVHTEADFDVPSYLDVSETVIYQWASSGNSTATFCLFPAQVHQTFSNMIWDDPTSGTNVNVGSAALPNPYTADQIYQALGFTGGDAAARKQAFIQYAVAHPEAHVQRQALNLLWAGYGMNHSI
jgi:hypothetical protein